MPLVHSQPVTVTYHANRISCASCCSVAYFIAIIVVPYVCSVAFGSFWTRESLMREKPTVRFRHEVLVEGYASATGAPIVPLGWSTSNQLNAALGSKLRPCELRAWSEDDELDGMDDKLQFVLKVPLHAAQDERLLSMSVLLGVDVQFWASSSLRINGSLHFTHSSPLPGRKWRQTATLQLRSAEPQRSADIGSRDACATPTWALQQTHADDGEAISTEAVLERYATNGCNDTVVLDASPPHWTPGVTDSFEAHLTVLVPSILTTRRPGLVETLKLGFVQYLALFIPIRALLAWVYGASLRYGVVAARVHNPIKQHRF